MQNVTSAGGVLIKDNKVLLCHATGSNGFWTLPKGGVEPGESEAVAALRETREETGYDAQIITQVKADIQPYQVSRRSSKGGRERVRKYLIFFLMRPLQKVQEPDGECDQFEWLDKEEALERITWRQRPAIEAAFKLF